MDFNIIGWWKGFNDQTGKTGLFPSTYVELINNDFKMLPEFLLNNKPVSLVIEKNNNSIPIISKSFYQKDKEIKNTPIFQQFVKNEASVTNSERKISAVREERELRELEEKNRELEYEKTLQNTEKSKIEFDQTTRQPVAGFSNVKNNQNEKNKSFEKEIKSAKVIYNYTAEETNEISINENQTISDIELIDEGFLILII